MSEAVLAQLTLLVNSKGEVVIERQYVPLSALQAVPEVAHVTRQVMYRMEDIIDDIQS